MQNTIIIINGLVLVLLIISFFKNRTKTLNALKIAGKSLLKLAPTILSVILLIGIIYGLFSDKIALLFGQENGVIGFTTIAVFGSVMHMPSLLAFPLAGSFLLEGVSISSIAAFITTLTMIVIFLSAWACIKNPTRTCGDAVFRNKIYVRKIGNDDCFLSQ